MMKLAKELGATIKAANGAFEVEYYGIKVACNSEAEVAKELQELKEIFNILF